MVSIETEVTHGKLGVKIIQQGDGSFCGRIGRERGQFLFPCCGSDTLLKNVEEYARDFCRHLDIPYFGVQYSKRTSLL